MTPFLTKNKFSIDLSSIFCHFFDLFILKYNGITFLLSKSLIFPTGSFLKVQNCINFKVDSTATVSIKPSYIFNIYIGIYNSTL